MALPCSSASPKVIPITSNKRFKMHGSKDFTVVQNDFPIVNQAVCANCNYGASPDNKWYPVMQSTRCPMCGSQKKRY